jgi:hypothetical protein
MMVAGGVALAGLAGAAGAQEVGGTRAVSFGIAGGATIPVGDAGDLYDTGFNLMGMLNVQPAFVPVGVRFDVMYHALGGKDVATLPGGGGSVGVPDLRVLAGAANAVLTVSNTGTVRPYVLGGVGLYNLSCDGCESETKVGLNGGGGIEFGVGGFNTFVEARFHSVFTEEVNTNLIPVVFGLRF